MAVFLKSGAVRVLRSERGRSGLLICFFLTASVCLLFFSLIRTQAAPSEQDAQAPYRGKLVAIKAMMVMASRAAPNQSHCC